LLLQSELLTGERGAAHHAQAHDPAHPEHEKRNNNACHNDPLKHDLLKEHEENVSHHQTAVQDCF
jgi:hypothetical protein